MITHTRAPWAIAMGVATLAWITSAAVAAGSGEPGLRTWPQRIGYDCGMSVTVADLDADGIDEIIACSLDGYVRVWDPAGTELPGWPYVAAGGGGTNATPACVDLDGDGDLEIVLPVPSDGIQAWHHDASPVAGWPQTFTWPQRPFASVSVGNLDQDPELEIVGSVNDPLALYVWNADGTVLPGWPRTFPPGWWAMATTALVDLDGDDVQEIVFVRWHWEIPYQAAVHLLDATGADLPGWPLFLAGDAYASPAVGDLDRDGEVEIVVVAGRHMHVFDPAGSIESGWPFVFYARAIGSPSLGQLNGEDALETAQVAGSDEFSVLNHDGTLLPGWPVDVSDLQLITGTLLPSPILVDLDGDAAQDILICGSSGSRLWAFDHGGNPLPGWPQFLPGEEPYGINRCTPVVGDPDRDGDVDVLCGGGDGFLYVWDLSAPFEERSDAWCSMHHDLGNTRYLDLSSTQSAEEATARQAGWSPRLQVTAYPNPCQGHLRLSLGGSFISRQPLTVEIFGPAGTRVATLLRGERLPTDRGLEWNACGGRGEDLDSGIYLLRVQCGPLSATKRIVLVR